MTDDNELTSPFSSYYDKAWPFRYRATLHLFTIAGGTPSNPDVASAWIASKMEVKDDRLAEMVAEAMDARGITQQQAEEEVAKLRHLNGFKKDDNGLYIEGRHVKAALKEMANVAAASGKLPLQKWGKTQKFIRSFVAEHIMVPETRIYLGTDAPDRVEQSFPENKRAGVRGIQLTEIVEDAQVTFEVISDWEFTEEQWALLWLTGEMQGLGAARSQEYGRYKVIGWERVATTGKTAPKAGGPE
jgi:hypothetical protein